MNGTRQGALAVARRLTGLVIDDGLTAGGALGAIGLVAVLSDDDLLGPSDALGWLLVVLVAGALLISVARSESTDVASDRPDPSGRRSP